MRRSFALARGSRLNEGGVEWLNEGPALARLAFLDRVVLHVTDFADHVINRIEIDLPVSADPTVRHAPLGVHRRLKWMQARSDQFLRRGPFEQVSNDFNRIAAARDYEMHMIGEHGASPYR